MDELADGAAEIGGITGFVEPLASSDADIPVGGGNGSSGNGKGSGQLAAAEQSGGSGGDRGSDSPAGSS